MDGVELLHRARGAGLRITVSGSTLKITGPRQAEPVVRTPGAAQSESARGTHGQK